MHDAGGNTIGTDGAREGESRLSAVLARLGSGFVWGVLPTIVLLLVAGYIGMATVGHVNPPVVPVSGVSMRPTLQAGDLVFLKGVDPKTLKKGDIVAVSVPDSARKQYDLPAHIVHRIIKVGHDEQGLVFTTKGDSNAGPDVFVTHANDVIGELRFDVPGAGYPFLFFRSRQGEIFLGAAALLLVLYFGLGLLEERRIVVEGTAVTMQMVLDETQVLRETIARAERMRAPDHLLEEVVQSNARSDETAETMRRLVGAIAEYGEHLRSHTAVMQNLAATTRELQRATEALGSGVRAGSPRGWAPLLDLPVLAAPDLAASRPSLGDDSLDAVARRLEERTRELERLRDSLPSRSA